MRFGLDVPTTGEYADPRTLARLATEAEVMGWNGFFIWDVLLGGKDALPSVCASSRITRSGASR